MNSEQLALFNSRLNSLKCFIEHGLSPLIGSAALQVAKAYYGGATATIKVMLENHKEWRRDFTPEEIAEFDLMEKEKIERDLADFTPNLESPMYHDNRWIAQWLLSEADNETGDFDDVFERIMMHRYDKSVEQTIDGETAVYRKVKTIDELDSVITGY